MSDLVQNHPYAFIDSMLHHYHHSHMQIHLFDISTKKFSFKNISSPFYHYHPFISFCFQKSTIDNIKLFK